MAAGYRSTNALAAADFYGTLPAPPTRNHFMISNVAGVVMIYLATVMARIIGPNRSMAGDVFYSTTGEK